MGLQHGHIDAGQVASKADAVSMAAIRDDRNRTDTSQCGVECAGHFRCAGSQGQIAGDIGAGTLFKAELEGA